MHLFYCTSFVEDHASLSAEESAHCIRVLRMKRGDQLNIIDGKGHLFEAYIDDPDPLKCRAVIKSITNMPHPRKSKLHIAIAPTKNIERFEWFIEKAVEIGIDEITPLLCKRSERTKIRTDRIEKLIISSMKQAKNFYKPVFNPIIEIQKFISNIPFKLNSRFIAYCDEQNNLLLNQSDEIKSDTVILIGPEGDFSPEEVELSVINNIIPVSLGTSRLRTETAGIVACCLYNALAGPGKIDLV